MLLKLPQSLKSYPFSFREAKDVGFTFYELKKLIQAGVIEQVARGIYRVPQPDYSEEDQFRVATLQVGSPSAICLVSALSFYGITDVIAKRVWLLVPNSKRIKAKDVRLIRARDPLWDVEITQHVGYCVTSLERTLAESLVYSRMIGGQTGIQSLKQAIQEKKTSLSKVFDVAVKLKVNHRILPYIEALA